MNDALTRALPDKVETVLFDAGGVLLDLDYSYLRRLAEARNLDTTESALSRAESRARMEFDRRARRGERVADVWRDYFHRILDDVGLPRDEHEEVIDILWEAHHRVGLWTVPVRGAVDVVREVRRRGFRVAVVSNAEGQVARDLDAAGFGDFLEHVVDSHVVGVEKPDRRIFDIALDRLEMPAGTAIFIGDVPSIDVDGARSAGIAPILLDRHDLYRDVEAPRLRSIKELPPLLEDVKIA